jgi:hypothetical protein
LKQDYRGKCDQAKGEDADNCVEEGFTWECHFSFGLRKTLQKP